MISDKGKKPAGGLRARMDRIHISAPGILLFWAGAAITRRKLRVPAWCVPRTGSCPAGKQLRVVVHFLVVFHLLGRKVSKIVAGQPADEKTCHG